MSQASYITLSPSYSIEYLFYWNFSSGTSCSQSSDKVCGWLHLTARWLQAREQTAASMGTYMLKINPLSVSLCGTPASCLVIMNLVRSYCNPTSTCFLPKNWFRFGKIRIGLENVKTNDLISSRCCKCWKGYKQLYQEFLVLLPPTEMTHTAVGFVISLWASRIIFCWSIMAEPNQHCSPFECHKITF